MRLWLIGGAINGVLGILGGILAGHAALPVLVEGDAVVRMGEHYQFWHAAVLIALSALPPRVIVGFVRTGGNCILIGATIFGVAVQITAVINKPLLLLVAWPGLAILSAGWLMLLVGAIKMREQPVGE